MSFWSTECFFHVYCVPADGQCYEYKWMASAWKGSSRTVWCQRSDGINVTGKLPISFVL